MSITTKTGDKGETALFGGRRVKKHDPQVEAYGAIDEATCFIGSAIESVADKEVIRFLTEVQYTLYILMAYLSGYEMDLAKVTKHLTYVEKEINNLENFLPKLTRFILPQGSEEASRFQISRAMVRSAERRVVAYVDEKKEKTTEDILSIQYLNRLSDLLFMFARKYTPEEKQT